MALKLAIVQSGKTQRVIARKIRIDETRFSRIISRKVPTTKEERERIAQFLHYDEAALFPEAEQQAVAS